MNQLLNKNTTNINILDKLKVNYLKNFREQNLTHLTICSKSNLFRNLPFITSLPYKLFKFDQIQILTMTPK